MICGCGYVVGYVQQLAKKKKKKKTNVLMGVLV